MIVFKIRNKECLYWEGHSSNKFTKKGKTWKQINHAKSAITNAMTSKWDYDGRDSKIHYENRDYTKVIPKYLEDCEIVKFELKEIEVIKIN